MQSIVELKNNAPFITLNNSVIYLEVMTFFFQQTPFERSLSISFLTIAIKRVTQTDNPIES